MLTTEQHPRYMDEEDFTVAKPSRRVRRRSFSKAAQSSSNEIAQPGRKRGRLQADTVVKPRDVSVNTCPTDDSQNVPVAEPAPSPWVTCAPTPVQERQAGSIDLSPEREQLFLSNRSSDCSERPLLTRCTAKRQNVLENGNQHADIVDDSTDWLPDEPCVDELVLDDELAVYVDCMPADCWQTADLSEPDTCAEETLLSSPRQQHALQLHAEPNGAC